MAEQGLLIARAFPPNTTRQSTLERAEATVAIRKASFAGRMTFDSVCFSF